jgi:hypothetical protein
MEHIAHEKKKMHSNMFLENFKEICNLLDQEAIGWHACSITSLLERATMGSTIKNTIMWGYITSQNLITNRQLKQLNSFHVINRFSLKIVTRKLWSARK